MTDKVYLVWHRDTCDHRDRLHGIYRDKNEAVSYATQEVTRGLNRIGVTPQVFPPDSEEYNDAKFYAKGNHLIAAVGTGGYWELTVEETPIT
jgi:hypothetical protein